MLKALDWISLKAPPKAELKCEAIYENLIWFASRKHDEVIVNRAGDSRFYTFCA